MARPSTYVDQVAHDPRFGPIVRKARAHLGNAVKTGDTSKIYRARQALGAAHLERAIRVALASDPPIEEADRERLARLLGDRDAG